MNMKWKFWTFQAAVSMRRVISLLEADELDSNTVTKVSSTTGTVSEKKLNQIDKQVY